MGIRYQDLHELTLVLCAQMLVFKLYAVLLFTCCEDNANVEPFYLYCNGRTKLLVSQSLDSANLCLLFCCLVSISTWHSFWY